MKVKVSLQKGPTLLGKDGVVIDVPTLDYFSDPDWIHNAIIDTIYEYPTGEDTEIDTLRAMIDAWGDINLDRCFKNHKFQAPRFYIACTVTANEEEYSLVTKWDIDWETVVEDVVELIEPQL